jgi:tRNA splicing endonuclease
MKHNKIMGACFVLGVLLLFVSTGYSKMVTVVGQGVDRKSAIADAQRAAVEQGIGTLIDSKTSVANFEVLQDKIYSRASGYVTNYNILSEGKTPDGSTYTVTMKADVQTASIKNDLKAIGILMAQIGNPRFMAVYIPETRSSMHRDSRVVRAAEQAINGVFARKGFIVLDKMFVNDVYSEIEQAGRIDVDMDDLSALALKYKADLLLVYDVHAASKTGGQSKFFGGVIVEIALRAVAPATADLIAQKSGDLYVKTMKASGNYYEDMQAAKAADQLGKAIADALIEDTLSYFERAVNAGTRFDVWFRNFSEQETYVIVDVIEQMTGFKDKNVRNESPGNFQLDVSYQGKSFDFKRELYRGLQDQGILFDTQQAKGNRFLLFKKGSDNPFGAININ